MPRYFFQTSDREFPQDEGVDLKDPEHAQHRPAHHPERAGISSAMPPSVINAYILTFATPPTAANPHPEPVQASTCGA